MENRTFHLGITMAGAVSAGAYTAGFMDYLLEVLELWEKRKEEVRYKIKNNQELSEEDKRIPLHDVCIEVFGGASAGGMTGVMTALSTFFEIKPIRTLEDAFTNKKTGNILYDSWVLLDDDLDDDLDGVGKKQVKTFEKMLLNDDFENSEEGVPSLLNSKSIDRIADNVFDKFTDGINKKERPRYISEDLRVLVTLCSLRGVPFEVEFKKLSSAHFPFSPGHRMHEHMIIAHFKTKWNEDEDKDVYLKFDPCDEAYRDLLNLCTKATGAFPVGLTPRHFENKISTKYIKNAILRSLELDNPDVIDIKISDTFFDFTDIDGGTINNEPYGEVAQVLEKKNPNYNPEFPNYGTIMIDPFPNFYNQDEAKPVEDIFENKLFQKTFLSAIPKIYTTLREQVRIKRSPIFYKDYFRLLTFPTKWEGIGELKDHPPIACSALGGFGGFLDVEFRRHDFFLGRNNARNFLRSYCSLEYDEVKLHPLFEGLTEPMKDEFLRKPRKNNPKNKTYFPIIPDVTQIGKEHSEKNPFHYDYEDFPKLPADYLKNIKPQLKKRLITIVNHELKRSELSWLMKKIIKLSITLFSINSRLTNYIINIIEKDLKNRKMLS